MRVPGSISGLATTKISIFYFLMSTNGISENRGRARREFRDLRAGSTAPGKLDHRAEVPKFGCSKLWTATNGAGKARSRTRPGANFIVRGGDSEYEGPKVDFGLHDTECRKS